MLVKLEVCTRLRKVTGIVLVNPKYVASIQPSSSPEFAHMIQVGSDEDCSYWVMEVGTLISACNEDSTPTIGGRTDLFQRFISEGRD